MKCALKIMAILLFGLLATSIFSCGGAYYGGGYSYYGPPAGYGPYWGGSYPHGHYHHYRPPPGPRPPRPSPHPSRR